MDHWMMLRASRILRDRYAIAHAPAEGRGWLRVFNAAPTAQLLFVALGRRKKGAASAPPSLRLRLFPSPFFPFFQIFCQVSHARGNLPALSTRYVYVSRAILEIGTNDRRDRARRSSRLITNSVELIPLKRKWGMRKGSGNIRVNRRFSTTSLFLY